jgi:hypothetical protein
MVEVENRHWQKIEHSPFAMPYVGQIMVRSFNGEELSEAEQVQAASNLLGIEYGLRTITLDADEIMAGFILTLRMEAESDKYALHNLCGAAINGWMAVGKEPEYLELVKAHLVYEPKLLADRKDDQSLDITHPMYAA